MFFLKGRVSDAGDDWVLRSDDWVLRSDALVSGIVRIGTFLGNFWGLFGAVTELLVDQQKGAFKRVHITMPMELAHLCQNFDNIFVNCGESACVLGNFARAPPSPVLLDASIWSHLPDSVLYQIFLRLPLKSLIRIRSLSKLWMSTEFFSDKLPGEPKRGRLALMKSGKQCEHQEVWVFDTPEREWCKFRLGCFPSSSLRFSGPFAAAGGLLCYIAETTTSHGGRALEIIVGNPLTQTWRLLAPNLTLHEFPTLAHMSMTTTGTQYSIVLVGLCEGARDFLIEVYDSISNTWRTTTFPPQLTSFFNFFKGDEYQGLATIDMKSKKLKRLMYPSALQESAFLNRAEDKCWILESRGSLFMCSNAPRMEGLWQRLETQWQRVCPFPKALKKYEKTALYLSDEVLLLVGSEPHCFPPQFEDADPHKIVMFNKVRKQWSILPSISANF